MSSGNWLNQDGLYLQYGTTKAIPEQGGEFLSFGSTREIETYINLGAWQNGTNALIASGVPSSFQGTIANQTATSNTGIQSFTTLFPLQTTPPVGMTTSGIYTANSQAANGVLLLNATQLFIDQVDLEVLVQANAGTGGATGLTGIGLVIDIGGTTPSWQQCTPNAGVHLVGAISNSQMVNNKKYTYYPDGNTAGSSSPPSPGSWLGNVPLCTNSPLPTYALISAIAAGGTYSGPAGGGLLKLRVRYTLYGSISY